MAAQQKNYMKPLVAVVVIIAIVLVLYFLLFSSMGAATTLQKYNHTSGNLTLSVSQSTGSSWAVAYVMFVPIGAQYSNGAPLVNWNSSVLLPNGLASGSSATVKLPVSSPVAFGTHLSGTVWSKYQINAGGTFYYAQVGSVNTTAV